MKPHLEARNKLVKARFYQLRGEGKSSTEAFETIALESHNPNSPIHPPIEAKTAQNIIYNYSPYEDT